MASRLAPDATPAITPDMRERSSPFLNAAAAGLGMTGEQLDALFIQAGGIAL